MYSASDAILCMSGDANWIGYGFETTWVLAYNAGTCASNSLASFPVPGRIAFSCGIGGTNGEYALAMDYADYQYNQNLVHYLFDCCVRSLNSTRHPMTPYWVRAN